MQKPPFFVFVLRHLREFTAQSTVMSRDLILSLVNHLDDLLKIVSNHVTLRGSDDRVGSEAFSCFSELWLSTVVCLQHRSSSNLVSAERAHPEEEDGSKNRERWVEDEETIAANSGT